MELLFMSNLFPRETKAEIQSKMRFNMYDAADVLQWNLIDGLESNGAELSLINLLPVDSWPRYYSEPFVKRFLFSHKNGAQDISIGYCNIQYIKRIFLKRKYVSQAKKWERITAEKDSRTVIAYSLNSAFIAGIKKIKRRDPTVKAVAVVADLPEFSAPSGNLIRKIYKNYLNRKIQKDLGVFDGFVLLTEHMAERMKIGVPYVVMEGIAGTFAPVELVQKKQKTIFYAGSMNVKYGITVLLDAFSMIKDPDMRLVLCGLGDAQPMVEAKARKDSRIAYLGKVSHERVLQLQQEATVLVNPRQNNEEFTRYSFPSKTMEYLASGVPVVAYKLDGIPNEYDTFLNYVENDSPEALAATLVKICEMDAVARDEMGKRGAEFVRSNKNAAVQTRKIMTFITSL